MEEKEAPNIIKT